MATEQEINMVLSDMRKALMDGKYVPIDRQKNLRTLAKLGYLWQDVKDDLMSLTSANYFRGPSIDRDFPNSDKLWEFKLRIGQDVELIYIKFKIEYQKNGDVKLLSFHFDEAVSHI